ncbi:Phage tail assembly chaperone protein, E, or 41 or 14 [Modicisalibacter ilicicola DSM 19980]|uniref:Phage tail assembly chaperone protein, E, or 41 or 14 n=1 Tax=Modicisalibacter ilicicola DSM 19980 TaxID=1121942 RepID=A0A1M4Y3H0_9GAMM|nr:phage tail assembly protein [Halomonas ilicicola]SHF00136.1 Phage tail assembly chaperone protein, E, or 41 or 14 [Halomonas ilicicola DSM 19980]
MSEQEQKQAPAASSVTTETVELDTPIQRGKQSVATITVRKPLSGALRGVSLTDVLQMDVSALCKVLPRITDPALTDAELRNLDPADMVQLGGVVAGFLLPKRAKGENPDYLEA